MNLDRALEVVAGAPAERLALLVTLVFLLFCAAALRSLWNRIWEREREIEEMRRAHDEIMQRVIGLIGRVGGTASEREGKP